MQNMLADMFKANNEAVVCFACARLLCIRINVCGYSFNISRLILIGAFINIPFIN